MTGKKDGEHNYVSTTGAHAVVLFRPGGLVARSAAGSFMLRCGDAGAVMKIPTAMVEGLAMTDPSHPADSAFIKSLVP